MNRQRLLWVILSVTALVIIVIGGWLLLFQPTPGVPVAELRRQPLSKAERFEYPATFSEKPFFSEGLLTLESKTQEPPPLKEEDRLISEVKTNTTKSILVKPTPQPSGQQKLSSKQKSSTSVKKVSTPVKATIGPRPYYWIQVGSYTSKSKADQCNELLAEHGLHGQIFSKKIDTTIFFRVRVGPFSNREEAGKFLGWIKKIIEFNDSFLILEISFKN